MENQVPTQPAPDTLTSAMPKARRWYQRWWFWSIIILLLIGIVWVFIQGSNVVVEGQI